MRSAEPIGSETEARRQMPTAMGVPGNEPTGDKAVDKTAEARKRMVSENAPGRMAKQARDKLALVTKTEKRALLQEDNRDIANLPNHIMLSEENAKLDYK